MGWRNGTSSRLLLVLNPEALDLGVEHSLSIPKASKARILSAI